MVMMNIYTVQFSLMVSGSWNMEACATGLSPFALLATLFNRHACKLSTYPH